MNKMFQTVVAIAVLLLPTLPAAAATDATAQEAGAAHRQTGAPHSWPGKPGGPPPQGAPAQGTPPAGLAAAKSRAPMNFVAPGKKTESGEQFFIVASVDLQKSQLLLKYPTEVTLLLIVNAATKFVDENGKPLKLSDFRAGDTVWMVSSTSGQGEATAIHVRKGQMTVADLHRYYLDYPEIK